MKKEAEGSMEALKTEAAAGGPHSVASSRREGVSLTLPLARTFLSVLFYIFYRSLSSHVSSRDFPLASLILSLLSSILLSLSFPLHPFHSLASCPLSLSFVASVVPRASPLLSDTLRAAL